MKSVALFGMASLFTSNQPTYGSSRKNTKKNVLFLFTDDQRYDAIRALGNPNIITPNLDKLVKRSFVFENAYCFGGNHGAVCIPARNMMMSGKVFFRFEQDARRCRKAGIKRRRSALYTTPEWPSFPKSMKAAGYETYFYEKSGSANNPDVRKQFDHAKDAHMVNLLKTGRPARPVVDETIEFIKDKRDKTKPFFIYLGLPCPHDPRWATKQFRDMYDPEKLPLPVNYKPVYPYDIGDMTVRDECLEVWPRTKKAIQRHLHDYYSLISSMDYDIGRLLDMMEETGLIEDTLIILSSDQGLAVGSHGLMGKQNIYEDTMRVPLLISGPGVPVGKSDALTYTHDIYPTVCDYVNTDIPEGLDGKSILPIVQGKKKKVRDLLYLAYKDSQRSVRDKKWKLIRFPQINITELYDVESDPYETNELSSKPEHKAVLDKMLKAMESQSKFYGDIVPLTSANPKPVKFVHPTERLETKYPCGGLAPEPWPEDMVKEL